MNNIQTVFGEKRKSSKNNFVTLDLFQTLIQTLFIEPKLKKKFQYFHHFSLLPFVLHVEC